MPRSSQISPATSQTGDSIDEYVKVYPADAGAATVHELGLFDHTTSTNALPCLPKD